MVKRICDNQFEEDNRATLSKENVRKWRINSEVVVARDEMILTRISDHSRHFPINMIFTIDFKVAMRKMRIMYKNGAGKS